MEKKARKSTMVTCRFCGKKIPKDEAFAKRHGKQNWYYCNVEHSNSKKPRELFYEAVREIIETTHTVFFSEMDQIAKVHGFEKMTAYVQDNKNYLISVMAKMKFANTYNMIKYFSAIIRNNVGDYVMKKVETEKEVKVEIYESKYKSKEQKKGLEDLLSDILDD